MSEPAPIERHIISVLVDNEPGVLARVIGLFSGRGYNIESLTVAEVTEVLLEHAGVAVAAGVGYGEEGEGFVRIAMVENEQRIRQAARNVKRFLAEHG